MKIRSESTKIGGSCLHPTSRLMSNTSRSWKDACDSLFRLDVCHFCFEHGTNVGESDITHAINGLSSTAIKDAQVYIKESKA